MSVTIDPTHLRIQRVTVTGSRLQCNAFPRWTQTERTHDPVRLACLSTVQRVCVAGAQVSSTELLDVAIHGLSHRLRHARHTQRDGGASEESCLRAGEHACERAHTHLTFTLLSLVDPVDDATNAYHHDREGDHARRRSPAHLTLPVE